MTLFSSANLSAMQAARLAACLDKQFRYSDGIRTLGADLHARHARGDLVAKKATDGAIDWSRTRFNRMNGREQAAYEARLKAKRYYWLEDRDGIGHPVPKIAFDAAALPIAPNSLEG